MPIRVRRMMQKVALPEDMQFPMTLRAPGLRFTSDNPTKPGGREFELSMIEAQVVATLIKDVAYVGDPFKKVFEVDEDAVLPTDEVVTGGSPPASPPEPPPDEQPPDEPPADG